MYLFGNSHSGRNTPGRARLHAVAWLLSVPCVLLFASQALAIYAYIPIEVRLLEADYVVTGKIEKLAKSVRRDGREYEVGEITVKDMLKGEKMVKTIHLAWPKPPGGGLIVADGPPTYAVGQDGIWILRADDTLPVYTANYPTDRQAADKTDDVKEKLESIEKLPWSDVKDGLQLAFFVEQRDLRNATVRINGKPTKAVAQLSVYPVLRNQTMKPLYAGNYMPDGPFMIELHGPDGKPISLNLYGDRGPVKPPLTKYNFIHIPPGKARSVPYGFGLPILTEAGTYTVALSYKNAQNGKELELDNVWLGEIAAPDLKLAVPPKPEDK